MTTTARRSRKRDVPAPPPATGWHLSDILCFFTLLAVPFGQVAIGDAQSRLPLPLLLIPLVLALADGALGSLQIRLSGRRDVGTGLLTAATVAVVVMALPLVAHAPRPSALLAFVQFATGTVGGAYLGTRWRARRERRSGVDAGLMGFALITIGGVASIGLANPSLSGFHQAVVLPWGGSNYVAGVLVVTAFALWSRREQIGRITPVVCAAAIPEVALGILVAAIARQVPSAVRSIDEAGRGALGILPVAEHDQMASATDLALYSSLYDFTGFGIDYFHFGMGNCSTNCGGSDLERIIDGGGGH